MDTVKTFLAGAFLSAGKIGALTHSAWTSTLHMASVIPAVTIADVVEVGGAILGGLLALFIVNLENRRRPCPERSRRRDTATSPAA
jgi:hypothetical protein